MSRPSSSHDPDQAWLDTLSGQRPDPDRSARDAQAVRAVLQAQAAEDAAGGHDTNLERRMLALLEANTAERLAARGGTAADGGLLARWRAWWSAPSAFSRPLAGGAVAALVAGVLVAITVTQEPDDAGQMKSPPQATPPSGPAASTAASMLVWTVPGDALAQAQALQRALSQAGALTTMLQGDAWVRLQVEVPSTARAGVAAALAEAGLAMPAGSDSGTTKVTVEVRSQAPSRP